MIAVVSGTNRPGSNTRKIATLLEGIYQSNNIPVQLLDLAQLPPEVFLPSAYAAKPASFQTFSQTVLACDGLHVVTPEYNGGMPGVLKYFIDLLKFPESFEAKPVCFTGISAGAWGALRPVEQLQEVFGYRNAHIFPIRVFLPQIHQVLDASGHLSNSDLAKRLQDQASGFVRFIKKIHS